jgi:hypothetical protein
MKEISENRHCKLPNLFFEMKTEEVHRLELFILGRFCGRLPSKNETSQFSTSQ